MRQEAAQRPEPPASRVPNSSADPYWCRPLAKMHWHSVAVTATARAGFQALPAQSSVQKVQATSGLALSH